MEKGFEKIISALKSAKNVGIFTHEHPDGDAVGSAYSLKLALKAIGKNAEVFLNDPPDREVGKVAHTGDKSDLKIDDCDLLAALDSADSHRLGRYEETFLKHNNTIAIDHHITHKPYASFASAVMDVSSTCEMMYLLYAEMGIEIDKDIARDLYIGLLTDTGSFKYECATSDTLRIAAALLDTGIDFSGIARALFNTKTREYYKLMETALGKLEYYLGGKVAALYISKADFENCGLDETGAMGIVTIPNSVEGVEVGAYIRQRGENNYKVSLRSNEYVNVAKIAEKFGGGGHIRAAGYSKIFDSPPEDCDHAYREIMSELTAEIKTYLN